MRFRSQKLAADLLIALLLLIMAYHRTAYTIGFMGWYDTFKNTKINYFLISLTLALGPIIYLYVRTTLKAPFLLKKTDWWHFLPVGIFISYRIIILFHDAQQEDWAYGYEGGWFRDIHLVYVAPFINLMEYSSQLVYLSFTIQLFIQYRQKIKQYFSNIYKLELNWLLIFLAVFSFLFLYDSFTNIIDAFIVELHYTHNWWIHFFSAIAMVYLGTKAYFTDLQGLQQLTFEVQGNSASQLEDIFQDYSKGKQKLEDFISSNQAYLQPNFTLKDLANGTQMGIHEVSEIINSGYGMNFNEFINRYRVEEVKKRLLNSENDHLSIIAIAYDSGFNSKATFNRVFKQVTGLSPSQFKKNQGI